MGERRVLGRVSAMTWADAAAKAERAGFGDLRPLLPRDLTAAA
jgi:hypothetical protein